MKFSSLAARRSLLFAIILLFASALAHAQNRGLEPTVILISIDGFRYDYIEKFHPPNISQLAEEGVRAKWMIPSFPTKTFPNHYTIVTGLYPEHHGIIENNIWDFGTTFSLGKTEEVQNSRWWLGEPIWVTAEKQGRRTASFFWPGTEAEIAGRRPTFWKTYDGAIPNAARVEQILRWLDLPRNERPVFYTLYFSDVDDAGHRYSPDSPETRAAVLKVDSDIKMLIDGLRNRGIDREVNIIIVSDHGMAAVALENAVLIDEYIDAAKAERILWTGEIVQIFPKRGAEKEIADGLRKIKHAACWQKDKIPRRLHYRASPRIAPIVCSAEEGWFMTSRERFAVRRARTDVGQVTGAHGYDNSLKSMRAIFIARGKAFKAKYVSKPFSNIHIYELMCKILNLKPAKNDGDLSRVKGLLAIR